MPHKIILDCDPGLDDAIAILLAHGNPEIDLIAITTVHGNQTAEKVTRNAQFLGDIAGITNTIFAKGAERPLVRPGIDAAYIHGDSGFGNVALPDVLQTPVDDRHAVNVIIDLIMSHEPRTITLVPTGALTNIALAARLEPRIVDRVKEVVLMGGSYNTGNRTPVAEFNVYADPEAAHIVFHEKWEITMVGLDLTHQALATPDVREKIAAVDTTPAKVALQLLEYFEAMYRKMNSFEYAAVHDPCTVAYVIDPTVFTTQRAPIDVELQGALTTGMTVVDLRAFADKNCHTKVAVKLDHAKFWGLVVDALVRIGDPTKGK